MKSTQWQNLLFAKFSSTFDRHTAVALSRSAGLQEKGDRVWPTQDPPLLPHARKMFLVGLKWQLSQWGFVKREIYIDEIFWSLQVGEVVACRVTINEGQIVYKWPFNGNGGQTYRIVQNSRC